MNMKVRLNNQELSLKVVMKNESDMNKCLRALRKYNMRAYKQFIFEVNELKHIEDNEYRIDLITDAKFQKIYGQVYMTVLLQDDEIILKRLEPRGFLIAGHNIELESYKGVPIISNKEKFKIDFLEKVGGLNDTSQ